MTWWRTTGRTPRTNTYLGGNGGTMAFTVSMGASEIKAYRVLRQGIGLLQPVAATFQVFPELDDIAVRGAGKN